MKGSRVRLRVVEEHDVALLAESPEDAKAQAQAAFLVGETIQDWWSEVVVSGEAVAVELYPDLE